MINVFNKFFSSKPINSNTNGVDQAHNPEDIILEALSSYRSDSFPEGIIAVCKNVAINKIKQRYVIELTSPFPCFGEIESLTVILSQTLSADVTVNITLDVLPVRQHSIKNVKNIIAIASGKGGVGKSTSSVNLAYALISEGAKVGILDADIYGPSIPRLLGIKDEKPSSADGKSMTPLQANKLSAMSIGFLVPEEEATVWRGPMASSAFSQLLNETDWPELDYLIIDMPPGTGDIQLTLAQKVPVAAAVIITTPQDIALADAIKGIAMFDKVKVPVLGIVENMSYHTCENCGHHAYLFGKDGGAEIAKNYQTKLLGQLPLDIAIREDADLGKSPIIENSTSEISLMYRKIARNISAQLFLQLDSRSPQTAEVFYNAE